jgi:hypothetical protein
MRVFLVASTAAATLLSACGGDGPSTAESLESAAPAARSAQAAGAVPPALWDSSGQPLPTEPEDRPADPAAAWSGQRYATRAQLAHEELISNPYTVVLDVPNANAVDGALLMAEQVRVYHSGATERLGVFVRAASAADGARVANRLVSEQGWKNVFVVQ